MNLKKILFIVFAFVMGIKGVAADTVGTCNSSHYNALEEVYKKLSVLSYYHTIYNSSKTVDENIEIFKTDTAMLSLFDASQLENIAGEYYHRIYRVSGIAGSSGLANKIIRDSLDSSCPLVDAFLNNINNKVSNADYTINQNRNTIDYLWNEVDSLIVSVANQVTTNNVNGDGLDYNEKYDQFKDAVSISYQNFCDYLNSHKGISYYLEQALNIVTYAALALGIFLGILDFIKAISSQDDAALTKAFQSFIKRVAAIALIFLSGVIVKIIVNIVAIPGVDRGSVICEQFDLGK